MTDKKTPIQETVEYKPAGTRDMQEILKIVKTIEKKVEKTQESNSLSSSYTPNEFTL